MFADEILDYSGSRSTGVVAGSYGPAADQSPGEGGTITVPEIKVNDKGAVTGAASRTVTLPAEPVFLKTPVVDITLASDATASAAEPYTIEVPGNEYSPLLLAITTPAADANHDGIVRSMYGTTEAGYAAPQQLLSTGGRVCRFLFWSENGLARSLWTSGASGGSLVATQRFAPVFVGRNPITGISVVVADAEILPAGTVITLYSTIPAANG